MAWPNRYMVPGSVFLWKTRLMGRLRWFADGHGLASPGRWSPGQRPSGDTDADLTLHKRIMDGLLRLMTDALDAKREMCRLAAGHAKGSPFPPALIKAGRDLVFNELRAAGSRARLEVLPERQPFYLEAISELLRLAGDPDWRRYTKATWSFASGVPLGVDVRLPRTPALFFRKTTHRKFEGAEDLLSDDLRENYPSAKDHEDQIEEQFRKPVSSDLPNPAYHPVGPRPRDAQQPLVSRAVLDSPVRIRGRSIGCMEGLTLSGPEAVARQNDDVLVLRMLSLHAGPQCS